LSANGLIRLAVCAVATDLMHRRWSRNQQL
jgi:hypothetical protein